MEIGRTCVHRNYRRGVTISVLWSGLARVVDLTHFSRMIGCASIPLHNGSAGAWAAYAYLGCAHMVPPAWRVKPRRAVPPCEEAAPAPLIPPLLKAYIRLGGKICGEPYWDSAFNTADLLILVEPAKLRDRYVRRYLAKNQ
jgi:putative hemolysin